MSFNYLHSLLVMSHCYRLGPLPLLPTMDMGHPGLLDATAWLLLVVEVVRFPFNLLRVRALAYATHGLRPVTMI